MGMAREFATRRYARTGDAAMSMLSQSGPLRIAVDALLAHRRGGGRIGCEVTGGGQTAVLAVLSLGMPCGRSSSPYSWLLWAAGEANQAPSDTAKPPTQGLLDAKTLGTAEHGKYMDALDSGPPTSADSITP